MLLMESIQKTNNLFHKTVDNLKSFFFVGFQKLSKKPAIPNPFSCTSCSSKKQLKDRFHTDFLEDWEVGPEEAKMRKIDAMTLREQMREEDECSSGRFMNFEDKSPVKIKRQKNGRKEEKNKVGSSELSKREDPYSNKRNGGSCALAKKMKELEMMDVDDMEHVLDVEEALHYYSRLKSPVYLSIVDKFFTDMHFEFSLPPALQVSTVRSRGSDRLGCRS